MTQGIRFPRRTHPLRRRRPCAALRKKLARMLRQAAQRATENPLISHAINPFFEPGPGDKPRWPRPRRSFARVRVRAPSTIGVAMLSVASTRTKSAAIIASRGATCGVAGITLVELLVAVLVMGIGVLGVAGLQMLSMQSNRVALLRSEAVQLAYDMMDRIRANSGVRSGAMHYNGVALGDTPPTPADCGVSHCTLEQMAVFDQAVWKCSLGGFAREPVCLQLRDPGAMGVLAPAAERPGLPEGDGAVAVDGATGLVRVTVQWRENNRRRSISIESRV